jgi:hypothetical protein
MADGFSCKTQVMQGDTGRRPLHTAQVIKMALDYGSEGTPRSQLPEESYPDVTLDGKVPVSEAAIAVAGVTLVGGALAWALRRRGR